MSYAHAREAIADKIRFVPDFPVEGVVFEDLTPALADSETFRLIVDEIADKVEEFGADVIGSLDARGFLLGSAVAYKLGLGVLAIRKRGKLPPPVRSESYELEYGAAALEIPADGVELCEQRVVLVDDVLATGGTLRAACDLLGQVGAVVTGLCTVLEVEGLGAREKLADIPLYVVNKG